MISKNADIYKSSCLVMPGGVNSPVRAFTGLQEVPLVAEAGFADTIVDADGQSYIDYCGSWGALIHGHAHPAIVQAACSQIMRGSSYGVTTEIEAKLAMTISQHVPSIEKLRFVSSGTEATMSAIRLARGFTGRDLILKFSGHYHGHSDSLLVQAGSGVFNLPEASSKGVPKAFIQHTLSLPFNDFDTCRRVFKEENQKIAAILVEPIAANMGAVLPKAGFLHMLREEADKCGALLIFDEVITGFRLGLTGAQGKYQITPDLTCLGKVIGGGFPAAAFGGRADIMDHLAPTGSVYQAGTLSGNPVAMHAGYAALTLCETRQFYQTLDAKTAFLLDPIQRWIEERNADVCLNRAGSFFTLFFGKKKVETLEDVRQCHFKTFKEFFKRLLQKGIYISPAQQEVHFVSAVHSEKNLAFTREAILESLDAVISQ